MGLNIIKTILICLFCFLLAETAFAGTRFTSSYSCSDAKKVCVSSGMREVDGFKVTRDCWEWAYVKTCKYPSKNDCRLYGHCYANGDKGCLLQDSQGNCVNMQREFSCKSWDVVNLKNQTSRMGFKEKPGKDGLVCKGVPCIDGHCVDKSYETNGKMMDSLSKLYATSNMNPDKDGNFNLFEGATSGCSKKALGYSNCCRIGKVGWGKNIGAKCTKDERTLMEQRNKNLCVYVGSEKKKRAGVHILTKHRYCCFGNILDKVIQVEGRKQLRRSFGTGSNPDCRGLSLKDIQAIDWNKVDFTEFIEDLKVKFAGSYKAPTASELKDTIEGSLTSINGFDSNLDVAGSVDSESFDINNPSNLGGINSNIKDDSWEAQEECRIAAEKREKERLARLEAERLEQERLAREEEERRIRLAQDQRRGHLTRLKSSKTSELSKASSRVTRLKRERDNAHHIMMDQYSRSSHSSYGDIYRDLVQHVRFAERDKKRIAGELIDIDKELENPLLPEKVERKKQVKERELQSAKSELARIESEQRKHSYMSSSFRVYLRYWRGEVKRLAKEIKEGAY